MIVCYSQFPRGGGIPLHTGAGLHGEAPGILRNRRREREAWAGAFVILSVGKARKGKVSRLNMGYVE